jgi:hypothetical protein
MYCPRCGEERVSEATSFCSRCGFLLTVTSELIPTGGTLPQGLSPAAGPSPRARGVRHGLFLLLLAAVVFPVLGMISVFALHMQVPWPAGVVLFLLVGGGLLRIAYALMFERGASRALSHHEGWPRTEIPGGADTRQLNADLNSEFSAFNSQFSRAGSWLDTNDLEPNSITDPTTKLLKKESELPE